MQVNGAELMATDQRDIMAGTMLMAKCFRAIIDRGRLAVLFSLQIGVVSCSSFTRHKGSWSSLGSSSCVQDSKRLLRDKHWFSRLLLGLRNPARQKRHCKLWAQALGLGGQDRMEKAKVLTEHASLYEQVLSHAITTLRQLSV